MSVFVTVEIGDESYCLTVTDTDWQIIKAGAPFGDTLKASYEGDFSHIISALTLALKVNSSLITVEKMTLTWGQDLLVRYKMPS